jgi:hypothetical protein
MARLNMKNENDLNIGQESNREEILMLINKCDLIARSGIISDECLNELKSISKDLLGFVRGN